MRRAHVPVSVCAALLRCVGGFGGGLGVTPRRSRALRGGGNLSFREREGYAHDGRAANEYMYNALRFFWN